MLKIEDESIPFSEIDEVASKPLIQIRGQAPALFRV
jgi:hypothetical protein